MAKNNNLKDYLEDLHEGIKTKKPDASRNPQDFRREIESIETGVSLDPLTNPATAEQILTGKETYDSDGNKVTGTMNNLGEINVVVGLNGTGQNPSYGYITGATATFSAEVNEEIDTQAGLIAQIKRVLNNKMAGDVPEPSLGNGYIELNENGTHNIIASEEGYDGLQEVEILVNVPSSSEDTETLKALVENTITDFVVPEEITKIGNFAFYRSTLKNITIPTSVTSIGASAFNGCTNLKSITIPTSVTSIGNEAFRNCSALTSIEIPSSVTSIGAYMFYSCGSLISITLPDNFTTLPEAFLAECSALTSIEIPSSVTSIGSSALRIGSSSKKATIRFLGTTPPTIKTSTFEEYYLQAIEVPASAVETYKAATNLSKFADYIVGY